MATALAEHGANVVISSRKQNELDEAAAQINEAAGRDCAIGIASNIGEKAQLADLVAQTKDRVGAINVLVGNAGVNVHYGPTHDIPDDAYEKIMSANVQSQLWLAREVHGQMVEQGGGSMMFTSSVGAFHASDAIGHLLRVQTGVDGCDPQSGNGIWAARHSRERHQPRRDQNRLCEGALGQSQGRQARGPHSAWSFR